MMTIEDVRSELSGIYIQQAIAINLIIEKDQNGGLWMWRTVCDGNNDFVAIGRFRTDLLAWKSSLERVNGFGINSVLGTKIVTDQELLSLIEFEDDSKNCKITIEQI